MAENEAPAKSGKGKLVIIAVAALVLLGAGGGAAWWFLLRPKAPPTAAELAAQRAKLIHYIALDSFTTNVLSSDGATHYLQVKLELKVADPKVDEQVKTMGPEISNQILRILGAQHADRVASVAVREDLQRQILLALNQILTGGHGASALPVAAAAPVASHPAAAASHPAAGASSPVAGASHPAAVTASAAAPAAGTLASAPRPQAFAVAPPVHFVVPPGSPVLGVYFDSFVVQ